MAADMAERLEGIRLSDREKAAVDLGPDLLSFPSDRGDRCLVGKVCSARRTNLAALRQSMGRIWKDSLMSIREIDDRLFLFEFSSMDRKDRFLSMEPWTYENNLVALRAFKAVETVAEMRFDGVSMWVQCHNLPLGGMSTSVGRKLGARLGEVLAVDTEEDGQSWKSFLRLRIRMPIDQPLLRGVMVNLGAGERFVDFKYERLPSFCFSCGRLGHSDKECLDGGGGDSKGGKRQFPYGTWMRAGGFSPRTASAFSTSSASGRATPAKSGKSDSVGNGDGSFGLRNQEEEANSHQSFHSQVGASLDGGGGFSTKVQQPVAGGGPVECAGEFIGVIVDAGGGDDISKKGAEEGVTLGAKEIVPAVCGDRRRWKRNARAGGGGQNMGSADMVISDKGKRPIVDNNNAAAGAAGAKRVRVNVEGGCDGGSAEVGSPPRWSL